MKVPSLNGVGPLDFESHVDHLALRLMIDWRGVNRFHRLQRNE